MTARVFGLSYNDTGSASLWPWALLVCDLVSELPTVGLVEDMQAYAFQDENYYVVNADGDWEIDPEPDLHYASAPELEALARRVAALEDGGQEIDCRSPRDRLPRGNRISTTAASCGERGSR